MSHSRRKFLKTASVAALFVAAHPNLVARAAAAQSGGNPDAAYYYTVEMFSGHLNTRFLARQKSGSAVALKLHRVTDRRPLARKDSTERTGPQCFSLVFRGPLARPMKQDVYELEHDALGLLSLLLVPVVSRDTQALYYEAIINHRRP